MRRLFNLMLGALAMLAVALVSAFIAMRLAIHGREVDVPALAGLTVAEANGLASEKGLNLNLENRFYSKDVPAGRILAQEPAAGSRVRREWEVRITESLGPQRVKIPDLTGETERSATVGIRRLSLELGSVAHLPMAGDPGVVIAQTPPSNSAGVDGPRVSLLLSEPEDGGAPSAYVMPSFTGLTYRAAIQRASAAGLRLVVDPNIASAVLSPNSEYGLALQQGHALSPEQATLLNLNTPTVVLSPNAVVMAQSPQPGHHVVQGDAVHVTLGSPARAASPQ